MTIIKGVIIYTLNLYLFNITVFINIIINTLTNYQDILNLLSPPLIIGVIFTTPRVGIAAITHNLIT